MWRRPNGLQVGRMRIPLGVIAIIYESRPNVTADAAGLCVKSGNAVILRGGSETIRTNVAIGEVLRRAAREAGIPDPRVTQHHASVRFASIAALVSTERACVWTLGGLLEDAQFDRLLEAAETDLSPFRGPDGAITFDMPALILTAHHG